MNFIIDRRKLLGMSLLAATQPLMASDGIVQWLSASDVHVKVEKILNKHLAGIEISPQFISQFVVSLKTSGRHTESPKMFATMLDESSQLQLEAYIVEEFITHSNYFMVESGEASRLEWLERTA